jgi:hypothetical protein
METETLQNFREWCAERYAAACQYIGVPKLILMPRRGLHTLEEVAARAALMRKINEGVDDFYAYRETVRNAPMVAESLSDEGIVFLQAELEASGARWINLLTWRR